ncbi:MAG: FtsQ-type POTRA domain-containing protein [Gemmatimonadota bacterium]
MRRVRGVGVLGVVVVTMVIAVAWTSVPEALGNAELFRVRAVEMEGERFLTEAELERLMALSAGATIWEDSKQLELRIEEHALVLDARVRRRLPGTLRVEIRERDPVALLPRPVMTAVDREGQALPVDPVLHRLDLPILQPVREPWSEGISLTPSQIGMLAAEVAALSELDPELLASVSELAVDARGDVIVRLGSPEVTLRYRAPLAPARLREGLRVLDDALRRIPDRRPTAVDLRFDDQVVVQFPQQEAR